MASQDELHKGRKGQSARPAANSIESASTTAAEDENPLSEREMEVSRLLATGASNAEIARELVISPHTVKVHVRNVFEKLQVSSRTEATLVLLQRGWVAVPGVEAAEPEPVQVAIPEPEPLDDLRLVPAPWQRWALFVALALAVFLLAAPAVLTRPKTSFTLLSDAGLSTGGRLAPEALARWEARMPLAQARSRHGAALLNGEVFVVGGENAQGQTIASTDAYDLLLISLRSLALLPGAAGEPGRRR